MAIVQDYVDQVQEIFIAYYGRPADVVGLDYWTNVVSDANGDIDAIMASFGSSDEAASLFGGLSDVETVNQLFNQIFGRDADASGLTFYAGELAAGRMTSSTIALNILNGATGDDATIIANKLAVAKDFTASMDEAGEILAYTGDTAASSARALLASVTVDTDPASVDVDAAIAAIAAGSAVDGATAYLTTGQDLLTGTSADDLFIARGNSSLDNADIIDGGLGRDTVEVMLDSNETAESPLFTSIEVLKVQAQEGIAGDGENDVDVAGGFDANIDAGDMESVEEYWSEDSRAHVTIEDVSRNSHITTVGFRESDPGADVDLNVFFDPQNITAKGEADTGSTLEIKVANVYNIAEGLNPLDGFKSLNFVVDGETISVSFTGLSDYPALVGAIEAALTAAGVTGVTVADQPADQAFFSIDIEAYTAGSLAGTYLPILLTSATAVLEEGTYVLDDEQASGNMVQTMSNVVTDPVPALTSVEVILDRVGKNSDGGDLLIGSDSTGPSGSAGIQQFNIDVDRDSAVRTIASTNNTLEVINVENISDNSDGTGSLDTSITDVRVFDASTMAGDVTLDATLGAGIVAKYLELTDDAADPSADNSQTQQYRDVVDTEFSYDFGAGDDSLDLALSASNLAAAGTASREDFVLEINGGSGDDSINTEITGGTGSQNDNWYINHRLNSDLTVNTNAGDDTVNSEGQGDWTINTGADSDTVYANNDAVSAGTDAVNEVQTLTFAAAGDLANGAVPNINVHGLDIAITENWTANQVAAAVAAAHNNVGDFTNVDGGFAIATNNTVSFQFESSTAAADKAPIVVIENISTDVTVGIAETSAGTAVTAAVLEVTNVTLNANNVAAGATFSFDTGLDIAFVDTDTSGEVTVFEQTEQMTAWIIANNANFTVSNVNPSLGTFTLTEVVANGANITTTAGVVAQNALDLNVSAGIAPGVAVTQAGAAAGGANASEVQTLTFTGADRAGSITISTLAEDYVIAISAGNAADVAAEVAAALNGEAEFTSAVVGGAGLTETVVITFASFGDENPIVFEDGAVIAATTIAEAIKGVDAVDGDAATWVINANNVDIDDLQSDVDTTAQILYKATLTVTFSGAQLVGASGLTADAAVALSNGFESTVTIPTSGYVATELEVNQAIKDAINNDAILNKLLVATDGPANTLVITSKVDGVFNADDLAIDIAAASWAGLTNSEQNGIQDAWEALNNDSTADFATDTSLAAQASLLENAIAGVSGGTQVSVQAENGGDLMAGGESTTVSDNTINLGSGVDDLAVLGTDLFSNDTIVLAGSFGHDTVFNFTQTHATAQDMLDVTDYLGNMETLPAGSTSTASQTVIATNAAIASGADAVEAGDVYVVNDFAGAGTETWANLTATELLDAINSTTNTAAANDYASFGAADFTVGDTNGDLVGTALKTVIMVENDLNDGEYKVFEVTSTGGTTDEFASVTLVGTVDLGDTLTDVSVFA